MSNLVDLIPAASTHVELDDSEQSLSRITTDKFRDQSQSFEGFAVTVKSLADFLDKFRGEIRQKHDDTGILNVCAMRGLLR